MPAADPSFENSPMLDPLLISTAVAALTGGAMAFYVGHCFGLARGEREAEVWRRAWQLKCDELSRRPGGGD